MLRKVLAKERMTGAKMKANIPATLNPGTNREANQKHNPLITKENAPKLRILRGKDNKEIIGLIPALTMPMLAAAIKAAGKLAILTPEKMISTTNKLRVVAKIVKSELNIIVDSCIFWFLFNFLNPIQSSICNISRYIRS